MKKYVEAAPIEKGAKKRNQHIDGMVFLGIPYGILIFTLIIIPMIIIVGYSIIKPGPRIIFTLEYYGNLFIRSEASRLLWESLKLAGITTILCFLIGYPTAYFITKLKSRNAKLMVLLITAPMWINMLLRTFAWMQILDDQGPLNQFLRTIGIIGKDQTIKFIGTDFAIVLGMVYVFLPFMILPVYSVLQKMDKSYIEASNDLGAGAVRTFFKVTLPLSITGVLSGVVMVLLPAATTLIIPKYLGEGRFNIGTYIENYFYLAGDWSTGSAISIVLALMIMAMVYLIKKLERRGFK